RVPRATDDGYLASGHDGQGDGDGDGPGAVVRALRGAGGAGGGGGLRAAARHRGRRGAPSARRHPRGARPARAPARRREPAAGEARRAGGGWRRGRVATSDCRRLMSYLTRSPISLDVLLADVSAPERGGTCVFLGTVRSGPEEQGVTAIEYSAYEAMVEAEFGRLLADAGARWPEARIAVRHRLGVIPSGEASIAIAAAAPHRAEAFE